MFTTTNLRKVLNTSCKIILEYSLMSFMAWTVYMIINSVDFTYGICSQDIHKDVDRYVFGIFKYTIRQEDLKHVCYRYSMIFNFDIFEFVELFFHDMIRFKYYISGLIISDIIGDVYGITKYLSPSIFLLLLSQYLYP